MIDRLCQLERTEAGGTRCTVCGWAIAATIPLDAKRVCHGLAARLPDCPVTGQPCEHLRLNQVSHYCSADLPAIDGPCSPTKRARAVAVLAARIGQECPHGR